MGKRLFIALAALAAFNYYASAQRVIAYYANWTGYTASASQYSKLTEVNWSFLIPNSDGTLQNWQSWEWTRFNNFLASAPGTVKKKISVGGDGASISSAFSAIAGSSSLRTTFATNLANFVQTHNLDGVDMDWEFPASGEASNFANMMIAVRAALDAKEAAMGKELELSMAVFSTAFYGTSGINSTAINTVDFINIMAYDNNADQNHSTTTFANNAISFWNTTKGVPLNKIVLGLPFYARPAYSVASSQPYNFFTSQPSAYNSDVQTQSGTWYYNGRATIQQKVQSALTQGLLGVMFWELSNDRTDQYSLLNVINTEVASFGCLKPNFGASSASLCGVSSVLLNSGIATGQGYTYVWKRNGTTIGGANTNTYSATQGGVYEVFTTLGGCTKSASIEVVSTFPPLDLGADVPMCPGETVTLDALLSGTGYNYSWLKDGSTPSGNTKTIQVTASGNYQVTISDAQGNCPNISDNLNVTPSTIQVQGASVCLPSGTANLQVLSAGGPYSWFNASTGGSLLGTGSTYSPTVSSNTTFYVQKAGGSISQNVGKTTYTSAGGTNWYNDYSSATLNNQLIFNVSQSITIDSVTIGGGNWNGTVTIRVLQSDGSTVVGSNTYTYAGSGTGIKIPLNITVPPGTGYLMDAALTTGNSLYLEENNTSGFPYPYSIASVVDIIGTKTSWSANTNTRYAGFYNWKISTGTPCPRVPVTATMITCNPPTVSILTPANNATGDVNVPIALTASASDDGSITSVVYTIRQGSTVITTLTGTGGSYQVNWTPTADGVYTITATATDNDNQSTNSTVVTVTIGSPATGIFKVDKQTLFMYPNPYKTSANISLETVGNYQLDIQNTQGILVFTESYLNTNEITLEAELPKGIYFVKISGAGKQYTGKLVKE